MEVAKYTQRLVGCRAGIKSGPHDPQHRADWQDYRAIVQQRGYGPSNIVVKRVLNGAGRAWRGFWPSGCCQAREARQRPALAVLPEWSMAKGRNPSARPSWWS